MASSHPISCQGRTPLESLLLRDRWLIGGALAIAIALCWAWIVPMSRDMYADMDGPSAWMMADTWDFAHVILLFAMWSVMMMGMMLPSAAPAVLLYAGIIRKAPDANHIQAHVYAFAGGYLLVWTAFSLAATALQRLLTHNLLLSPMIEIRARWFAGALLILAGIYQLTPFKNVCLAHCRSPLGFFMTEWRDGNAGALTMGIKHGVQCVGCCWMLMGLLFVFGVMNLIWVAVLSFLVLLEKAAPFGHAIARISGVAMLVGAVALALY